MAANLVLSHYQVEPIRRARAAGRTIATSSPDLGLTAVDVSLDADGARFSDGQLVRWDDLALIDESTTRCFAIEGGALREIRAFSEVTNRPCSLWPTRGAPTIVIAGFTMHRIKDVDPYQDTRLKVKAIAPVGGRVLDTTTGLGYTAIEAARSASEVVTIELDPAVLDVARENPWSRELFESPRIAQLIGSADEIVPTLTDAHFNRIIHDPPVFSLAGELYSLAFYRELHRVLAPGGRLFHYFGDLSSKSSGGLLKGVLRRLTEAGFQRVQPRPEAYGIVASR